MYGVTKVCFKCGAEKPLLEFYKHLKMKDGHLNKCKDCAKKDVGGHRSDNLDQIREYDRKRGNRQASDYLPEYRRKYPKKYKAHGLVASSLRSGKLKKLPCEQCGSVKSVAHHDDYNQPLDVRWLCQAHHKQWHAKNGEGANPF